MLYVQVPLKGESPSSYLDVYFSPESYLEQTQIFVYNCGNNFSAARKTKGEFEAMGYSKHTQHQMATML